ncbi:MAG: hypothetical protein KI790_15825 [Cyclobacteriaceae bacterium]|nr:hypothetical protein [Cyclobacteriaceae bacterium HetDA_MAG_MS6]
MGPDEWFELEPIDNERLSVVRKQFHQALQNVSAVGRKFLPESSRDENAILYWVPQFWRLAGKWIGASKTFRSSISFSDQSIHIVDREMSSLASFGFEGKTHNQVMVWLEEQIKRFELSSSELTMSLPYELPPYPTQKGKPFENIDPETALILGAHFHNCHYVLSDLRSKYEGASEIRLWPHHFDLAISILVKDSGDYETSTYVSAGLSPGDQYYDQPYFYVNSWPYADESKLQGFSGIGAWHTDDWLGAVVMAEELWRIANQENIVKIFYQEGIDQLINVLLD